ncbi:hypothetical protein BpHYR1_024776 [Brachionus plicatilis]|uniref:Uncharacterized protein n=1 Tax=Brachionus plicatilis TaxID=10195 RepID=A0A3M7S956_BRAPC|nr:hypothetical protein BpHYR1_024776 [Brachionus plicatilis]
MDIFLLFESLIWNLICQKLFHQFDNYRISSNKRKLGDQSKQENNGYKNFEKSIISYKYPWTLKT